jgi:hypothetical protein
MAVATAGGLQYARLGMLFLGDTEVWRTTTAQPAEDGTALRWTQ